MWVAPIRVYYHLSREIPFASVIYRWCPFSGNGGSRPTVGDIHSIHSSEMSGRSCVAGLQDVLVESSVFLSRGTLAKGGSIPCHSWKSITQYVLAVLTVYYICGT